MTMTQLFRHRLTSAVLRTITLAAATAGLSLFLPSPSWGWTAPSLLNTTGNTDNGHDFYASIAPMGHGRWVAVWQSSEEDLGGTSALHGIAVATSSDGGLTWSTARTLYTNAQNSRDQWRPQVAADALGRCVAIWVQLQSGDEVGVPMVSRSTDFGATWSPAVPLDSDEDGADIRTTLATDQRGLWIAVWADSDGVRLARSLDNGASWSDSFPISSSSNRGGIPHIETDERGTWIVTWTTTPGIGSGSDNEVVVTTSFDHGFNWSAPSYLNVSPFGDSSSEWMPQLATDRQGNWLCVWQTLGSGLSYVRSTDGGSSWNSPTLLFSSYNGDRPAAVAADRSGNWTLIWESTVNSDRIDLYHATSTNVGANWTTPQHVVTVSPYNTSQLVAPVLATDTYGRWLAAWYSLKIPGNPLGSDADVYFSTHDLLTNPRSFLGLRQTVRVNAQGTGYQELVYNYSNTALDITPYSNTNQDVPFARPAAGQWVGVYHYDYFFGAYREALYEGSGDLN